MGLVIAVIARNETPGAAADTQFHDIKKSYTIQNLVFSQPVRQNGATPPTLLELASHLDRIFINTLSSSNLVDWEGEHLYDAGIHLLHNYPLVDLASADNIPAISEMNLMLSPYPFDFDKPYGLASNRGTQIQVDTAAEPTAFDGSQYTLTAWGNPDIVNPIGMLANHRDAFSANAAGEERNVRVIGTRLAAIYNFGTTSFPDLAAANAFDITTFRDHAITESDDVKLGQIQDIVLGHKGAYEIGAEIDEGSQILDLGFNVSNDPIGIDISVGDWKYRNTRGATDLGVSYPLRIV